MKKIWLWMICLCCLTACQKPQVTPKANLNDQQNTELSIGKEETQNKEEPVEEVPPVEEEQDSEAPVSDIPNESTEETPPAINEAPSADTPQSSLPPVVEKEDPVFTVTISIECTTILNNMSKLKPGYQDFIPASGYILPMIQVEIQEGESVLSVLERACQLNGIKLVARNGYVSEIGNIGEYACGNLSGWMYFVNGAFINQSASQKKLQDGDTIKWMYTCDNGRDLSFS
ncbi:MAG: DUF4430 domain-containing protein [Beduini sp.]|uniref:DUF4430 domain-containing protein n=1 Tax=Beduini sp. TaxID=1922300 RepID=UPI0039A1DAE3